MISVYPQSLLKRLIMGLLAIIAALCLLLVSIIGVVAATVHIYDNAHVLNAGQVQSEAENLPDPIDIYTVNNFTGSSSALEQQASTHITSLNLIVMAIDTVNKHVAIVGGTSIPLTNSQYNAAINAFKTHYGNGDYTAATIAAIASLRSQLGAAPVGSGTTGNTGSGSTPGNGGLLGNGSALGFPFGLVCCLGLLVLLGIAVFAFFSIRRRRSGLPSGAPPYGPYQQPYNQNYPPNYYGPGSNVGPGMNPWVAGGLGAAAGGLAGYELGRAQGEEEAREQGQGNSGNLGGAGDFGGGAAGDFGNAGGGDFGGGGGGDFGGGSSGSF